MKKCICEEIVCGNGEEITGTMATIDCGMLGCIEASQYLTHNKDGWSMDILLLMAGYDKTEVASDCKSAPINYCPFCGREL